MPKKIFISYRKLPLSKQESKNLRTQLIKAGYEVFLDERTIGGGTDWQKTIYEEVRKSGVLIVLLQDGTAESEWVQREVDLARGAQVNILPIRLGHEEFTDEQIQVVQQKLAITHTHYMTYCSSEYLDEHPFTSEQRRSIEAKYEDLLESIEDLITKTRKDQREWAREISKAHALEPATFNREAYHFPIENGRGDVVNIYMATGDLTQFRDIDVIVNSENDYMQMARFFENHTVSSVLRYFGSYNNKGVFLHDRIQEELDDQITSIYNGKLPISLGQVVVTSAGHPKSRLVQQGIRYIFHATTNRVDTATYPSTLNPLRESVVIKTCVTYCLEQVITVDNGETQVFNEDSRFTRAIPSGPIKNIVFPIFGTGHGGLQVTDVAQHMTSAIMGFIRKDVTTQLENIYLCVYSQSNINAVEKLMQAEWNKHRV